MDATQALLSNLVHTKSVERALAPIAAQVRFGLGLVTWGVGI